MENPCKNIKVNEKATVDIPFNGERIRFENLSVKQMACLLQLFEFHQLSGTRRSALLKL